LHYFKEELTGPEFASRFINLIKNKENIDVFLNTTVVNIKINGEEKIIKLLF